MQYLIPLLFVSFGLFSLLYSGRFPGYFCFPTVEIVGNTLFESFRHIDIQTTFFINSASRILPPGTELFPAHGYFDRTVL